MAVQTRQSGASRTALIFLTVGALTVVWAVIWFFFLRGQHEKDVANGVTPNDSIFLWCYGFIASGVVLAVIGLAVGRIGRSAMAAETGATPDVAVLPTAAATGPATGNAAVAPAGTVGAPQQIAANNTVPPAAPAPVGAVRYG